MDVWGNPHQVSDDHLIATLEALTGRELDSEGRIDAAIADLSNERPLVEPVIVAWDGSMPGTSVGRALRASVLLEDGSEVPARVDDGVAVVDSTLPTGYHQLAVDGEPVVLGLGTRSRA